MKLRRGTKPSDHDDEAQKFWCHYVVENEKSHGNSAHSIYDSADITLTSKQLCAGLPATNNSIAAYNGQHEEDYGGPLICFQNKQPILTGISSSNSLSSKTGNPG